MGVACMWMPPTHDSGNETSAIVTLKAIGVAQAAYRTNCGNGAYASSLVVLAAPPGGAGSGFIDKELGSGPSFERGGYKFAMTAGAGSAAGPKDCNGTPTVTKFYASAIPATDKSGTRSFAMDQNAIVWQLTGNKAPAQPFGPPALPVQ